MLEWGGRTLIPQRYATVVTALISRQLSIHIKGSRRGCTHRCTVTRGNSSSEQRDDGRDESESPHFGGLLA
jgi:hypothetical protein